MNNATEFASVALRVSGMIVVGHTDHTFDHWPLFALERTASQTF